ncbi:MAG: tetratricopeptide repeat protein [Candidatus Cloacimonetes bacterium]|nr:tetratricopeptide repeat protein [Candidatus Cloacimonadota bacterium]
MRNTFIILTILACATWLFAQDAPFAVYQAEPSQETFLAAQGHFTAQLAENEADASARLMLGYLHLMELNRTIGWYDEHQDDLKAGQRFGWANLMLSMGRYDDALAQYDKLNESKPDWSCPWRHKGEAYYESGRYAQAATAFEKAIETRIEHYDAYVWLARAQHALGEDATALATLETGFGYYGKDIEDPDEEVDAVEVKEFYAMLLEVNGRDEEAAQVRAELEGN